MPTSLHRPAQAQARLPANPAAALYLDAMKRIVTNVIYQDHSLACSWYEGTTYQAERRTNGRDIPSVAHTMVGMKRLDNVHTCIERVLADGVPGDLIETGAWRGGVCIFMRAALKAYGITDRRVWVADSFEGIPRPGPDSHPRDRKIALHRLNDILAVSLGEVRENFDRYGLLDHQVQFLPGWFRDTLPAAPIDRLAVLRLDGDVYESTMDGLVNLYPKVSRGGYVIVDDYIISACREAVHDFRNRFGIEDEILDIDGTGVYWQRTV